MGWRDSNKYARYFWLFIGAITAVRLLMSLVLGIAPQEAYYWNYSQHPDLSYFDHPPMTAYLIYFFTGIFGDNTFGIHMAAVFVSFVLAVLMFYLLRRLFDDRIAFWSVVVGSTTLIFALGGLIITPDGPLLLFWLLMMYALYRAVEGNETSWWLLTGVFAGAALTSKYTAAFAFLGAVIFLLVSRRRRRYLITPGPYLVAIISGLVFSPVILWNYQHDWASFSFQSGRRAAEVISLRPDYFFGFLGSQIAVLAIFLMPLFIWGIVKTVARTKNDSRLALFLWFALPTLIFFTLVSPFHYVKMNWLAPAYLSGLPLAVHFYFESGKKSVKYYGMSALIFSIVTTITIHILVLLPGFGYGKSNTIDGWKELATRVDEIKTDLLQEGNLFICGYEYKTASELRFYLKGQPEVFSNNIVGKRGLAYDFWCDPDTLAGRNCIFVYDERNKYGGQLMDFFERVEGPEVFKAVKGGKKITDFYIYQCYRYKGIR